MRYTTYIGSFPFQTPATFDMISHLELVEGVYYVPGGTASIAKGFEKRTRELGVTIHTNCEAKKIHIEQGLAKRIDLQDGEVFQGDLVVVNADVLQAIPQLLGQPSRTKQTEEQLSPSAFVIIAGLNKRIEHLEQSQCVFLL